MTITPAYRAAKDADDGTVTLCIVRWEGQLHCAYLNDYRIAGGKPWGGGEVVREWKVPVREIYSALGIPAARADKADV